MPRYAYRCEICKETYEVIHGMNEDHEDCELCEAKDCLVKIPGLIGSFRLIERVEKPGQIVKNFIKDAKQELKEEKRNLASKEMQ